MSGDSSSGPARPRTGARYALERTSFDGQTVVYDGFVHLPEQSLSLHVELSAEGGSAQVGGPDPDGGFARAAVALLKAAAKLPRGPEAGPPPRRVARWRG